MCEPPMWTGRPTCNDRPGAATPRGINHCYGKQQALIDVAFSLPKGTRCGLIGPDGAGKSSLLGLDRRGQKTPAR
jgi:ABC-type branched-subunit amino acid transport system ATPase component